MSSFPRPRRIPWPALAGALALAACSDMSAERPDSFASAEETKDLTGMMIGGVTALALPAGLPLWVDERVMARPSIVLGGGSRSLKIRVAPEVLLRLPGTEVVGDLAT